MKFSKKQNSPVDCPVTKECAHKCSVCSNNPNKVADTEYLKDIHVQALKHQQVTGIIFVLKTVLENDV